MLDEKTTLEVARMIGEGLKYLKCKQIVHRNLKISNLLVIDGIVKISNLSCAVDLATDTKD
jgi:serine/threonine protein kinase